MGRKRWGEVRRKNILIATEWQEAKEDEQKIFKGREVNRIERSEGESQINIANDKFYFFPSISCCIDIKIVSKKLLNVLDTIACAVHSCLNGSDSHIEI